jgi:DNA-binding PadR family transcriptional regulator
MSVMSLRSAILGFLTLEPTSGYTLKQRFDGSVGSFWSVTQSQVYRELHALEADGLVSAKTIPGGGKPDRKVYSLTAAGRDALAHWLEEPLEPLFLRHPLLLKLVFSSEVPAKKLDALLAHYAEGVASTRADYQARLADPQIFSLARSPREATIWKLSIEHGLEWCDAELRWTEHARKTLMRSTNHKGGTKRWIRRTK